MTDNNDLTKMERILNKSYEYALNGFPKVSGPIENLVDDYMSHNPTPESAAKALISNQVKKCGVSGFATGAWGLIIASAGVGGALYIQLRMIAAIAMIGGYDARSDQVQTAVLCCLAGQDCVNTLRDIGVKLGTQAAKGTIKKIPVKFLKAINKMAGQRFITKNGTKGVINLGRCTPVVGAIVGGGIDYYTTKLIAKRAYKEFINENYD
jgi:hypothetical protein